MAELDYAFLCDYAQAENGKLTAIGMSYTYVVMPALPAAHSLHIAGRVRALMTEPPVHLTFEIQAPKDGYILRLETQLSRQEQARPYGDKVGLMFAATALLPIVDVGLYVVNILLDGEHVRRLAFECILDADFR